MVIFANEWEYTKLQTVKGRLFNLKNTCFEDTQFLFWMQYPNKNEDDLNSNIINNILKTGIIEINESNQVGDELTTNHDVINKDNVTEKNIRDHNSEATNNNVKPTTGGNTSGNTQPKGNFLENLAKQMRDEKKSK